MTGDRPKKVWRWLRCQWEANPLQLAPFRTDSPPPSAGDRPQNLPQPTSPFIGRTHELERLAAAFASGCRRVVLQGSPGVGKTTLALRYALTSKASFPGGVWWLDATDGFDASALRAARELEARFDVPRQIGSRVQMEPEHQLRRCLEAWPGDRSEAVLLVFDHFPPPPEGLSAQSRLWLAVPHRFRCLFTQRALPPKHWAEAGKEEVLPISVLPPGDTLELLKSRAGKRGRQRIEQEPQAAENLVEAVGRLPLAVVLLGGQLRLRAKLRLATLSEDLSGLLEDSARADLKRQALSEGLARLQAEPGLLGILRISWDSLGLEARELARVLSLTMAEPIPWKLVERCSLPESWGNAIHSWQQAKRDLVDANLLELVEEKGAMVTIHPLVRRLFALQCGGWKEETFWRGALAASAKVLARQWEGKDQRLALAYARQASHVDGKDLWAASGLGLALLRVGEEEEAGAVFEAMRVAAQTAKDEEAEASALDGLGDALRKQFYPVEALAKYQASLAIRETLLKRDPENMEKRHELVEYQIKIGDACTNQGDHPGALAAYQASLAITEDLAKREPDKMQRQRDRVKLHLKIGDLLLFQDKPQSCQPQWLAAFKAGLAIAEGLVKRDPATIELQHDLLTCQIRLAWCYYLMAEVNKALKVYKEALATNELLMRRDPKAIEGRFLLWAGLFCCGEILVKKGERSQALAAFQASLAIAEATVKQDPANQWWQIGIVRSCLASGSIGGLLPVSTRRRYLQRGRQIMLKVKEVDKLDIFVDHTAEFDQKIRNLGP